MSKPIVAVVGRPNVGKSTLFNKLCGQRLAIVEDTPGITRDRIFANCEWNGHEFLLVDTGGIEPKATEGILAHMREQAQIAIDTADCIIMVTDVRNGLTAADEDVAHMLRRSHKPIILAVNKCDKVGEAPMELYEFYNLGFDEVMPISSVHGHGTGDLLDAVCAHLDFSETVVEEDRIPVAIIGRPNVGKSTLFNKLCGQRLAIVEDTPGITRDRIFANCEWSGHEFLLVDTGGIEPKATEGILAHMREQAQIAIDTADCIIMVTDVRNGLTAADEDVAHMLRRSHKPVILAVNKCDNVGDTPMELYEFYNLGFDEVMPISSVHGHGTGDLLDAVCAHLDFSETVVEEDRIPVAIIGRPNVGKSSLTNRILGENRMIVANEAGTTRDAIDTPVDNAYGKFIFTDTAGLRKRSNITDGLERYMVVRALAAVERSRVALILVDATVGFTEQDSKVAGYAHDQGKACIIVVNKWDAVEGKETNTMELQRRGYAECFSFMGYAPIIFISAQTGYNVNKLMQLIRDVDAQNGARVPTGVLNEMLARATARMQPPSDKGRRLKIFYLTQASTRPPTFVAFVNSKQLFHFSYQRYLINQIRENFGLEHTPIRLVIRERGNGSVGAKDV